MKLTKRFLRLPVSRGEAGIMQISEDGKLLYAFSVSYDPVSPAYDVYADMHNFVGHMLSFTYNGAPINDPDEVETYESDMKENLRPLVHFTAPWGWINDPNGLSYDQNQYHLFCQHNPFGDSWGNMHWGHAVSSDLLHWEWRGDVLYPDRIDATMFSGSAVVDTENTAGFGAGAQVLIYTCADDQNGFSQNLAWSCDGEHYQKYERNPVLPNLAPGNRDPKVIRHEATHSWIMALYLEKDRFALFSSPDLKHWDELERFSFPGANECPDFFPLETPDGVTKWILWEAGCRYLIGEFDGKHFSFEDKVRFLSPRYAQTAAYAAQTFSGEPLGRRLMVFWEKVKLPEAGFTSQHSIPMELSLIEYEGELMISCDLPSEVKGKLTSVIPGTALFMEVDLRGGFSMEGHRISYKTGDFVIDDQHYPVIDPLVRLIVDKASIEIIAENGTKFYVHEGTFTLKETLSCAGSVYSING